MQKNRKVFDTGLYGAVHSPMHPVCCGKKPFFQAIKERQKGGTMERMENRKARFPEYRFFLFSDRSSAQKLLCSYWFLFFLFFHFLFSSVCYNPFLVPGHELTGPERCVSRRIRNRE